jgi:hypothetical protein
MVVELRRHEDAIATLRGRAHRKLGTEALSISVHNPDQYMASLRTIIAQGRKRIGLLVGAGAAAGTAKDDGTYPLIPAVEGSQPRT